MNRSMVNLGLLFIALIWGFGFVPQKLGLEHMDAAAFNAMRFALGAITLLPVLWFFSSVELHHFRSRSTLKLGVLLGGLLFGGALMQQISLVFTSVANVSFITGLYVIVVPVIALGLGYRYKLLVWSGGIVAMVGLYLLTQGGSQIALKGDLLAFIGAIFWALHLILVAEKAERHNALVLAFYQFSFCALFSLLYALIFESRLLPQQTIGYLWPLINGVIVVGIAYTLQVIVLEKAEPFAASVILSLEAVFGAVAAYFIFDESLTKAGFVGAGLMLLGCVLAQAKEGEKITKQVSIKSESDK